MRDFFEAQKHIIITLIVIIAITIVSGYFYSPQVSPPTDDVSEPPILIDPSKSEPSEKENDSLLQKVFPDVRIPGEVKKEAQEESKAPTISAKLIISGQTYSVSLPENSSVYNLMIGARDMHDISFGGKEYIGLGFFVDEINGVKNNANGSNKYWIYSINGKKADVGISQYIVKEGDTINWNYEDEE